MRYLAPEDPEFLGSTRVPVGLRCFGTEPFWGFGIVSGGGIDYFDISRAAPAELRITDMRPASGRPGPPLRIVARDGTLVMTAVIVGGTCSDGMADSTYPWSATVWLDDGVEPAFLGACCSLPLPE